MSFFPELLAVAAPPARGAPLGDIVWASAVATMFSALVLWIAAAHRAGRITWLATAAARASRLTGLPGWAALPTAVLGVSQLTAVFGFYWDVSKHIDTGRDSGPFGTAAHFPILAGLAGIALGGFLAIVLGADEHGADAPPSSVRLARGWHAPLGGLLIFVCGSFALIGFPLDDVWHTLFGQDVTLWGPTHVLMVGGASLSTLGVWVLLVEGARARSTASATSAINPPAPISKPQTILMHWREALIGGSFLIGLSTLQGEFDFGVPQFQLVYQPILIALATGAGLVAARVRLGRGGALFACLLYLLVFGTLSLVIHQLLGETALHFPLYIPEAILVELAALALPRVRPVTLGAVSGALIGTLGLAAEWAWSHLWMPLPWPASMLPEAAILGLAAALAGGVLGGVIGDALNRDRPDLRAASDGVEPTVSAHSTSGFTTGGQSASQAGAPAWLAGLAGAVALACIAFPMPMTLGSPTTVTATLHTVNGGPQRTVAGSFRVSPASITRAAQWVTVTAWQGDGLVIDRLRRTAPGTYATTRPLPAYGNWKTMLRIANGRSVDAVPIYMPADPAIPAKAVPALASFTRSLQRDKQVLQRESVGGALWLTLPAYLLLGAIVAGWLAAIALGLRRLNDSGPTAGGSGGRAQSLSSAGAAARTA
ncbi:MAG TPA: hypothetical protein VLJ42_08285 [Solirubrobacteraceae bacterium]|nr:hypothetical protein [Solirubrobacteraceae bacterium]